MNEQTAESAASSAAPLVEVDRGPLVNLTSDQRAEFRRTGELPEPAKQEQPKTEESATSAEETPNSEQEETPKGETQPDPQKKSQESRRKPDAEHRIKQLTDETKRLKAELETLKSKPTDQPKPVEQPKSEPQYTRPKPTAEDKDKDGNPKYTTYEDFVEDLADWKAEQRLATQQREQQQQAQKRELDSKVSEAKQRYGEKFEEILIPTVNTIVGDQEVSGAVKAMLNESEVLPDLLFTLGSNQQELTSFLQMAKTNPGKALRYIALTESLIREELSGDKGSREETPAKPQTQAPKPPAEVGGRASAPPDALESAAKAGDFRAFKAEATRRQLARIKG